MKQNRKSKKTSPSGTGQPESQQTTEITPPPDEWRPRVELFPTLLEGQQRTLYVAGLYPCDLRALEEKGYNLVHVMSMPRDTPAEDMDALEAWLQGQSEGTIEPNSERRRCLELEAHAKGLLVKRELKLEAHAQIEGRSLEALLARFTNHERTLMPVSAKQLKQAEEASIIPGLRKGK